MGGVAYGGNWKEEWATASGVGRRLRYRVRRKIGRGATEGVPRSGFDGIGDFFRDVKGEFQNWEASAASVQGKPKSLWEELAEIGEEFVEFLEKELNITDEDAESYNSNGPQTGSSFRTSGTDRTGSGSENKAGKGSSIEENIDDIEAVLAQLKKELGGFMGGECHLCSKADDIEASLAKPQKMPRIFFNISDQCRTLKKKMKMDIDNA
ncbi:uncharacterized protein LOC109018521 [Juglans regia]|uniref:Uncharacterized protein LOC109018521 n=1 Tax=Juglans regia TaxID=51240 RepID=A0A6P9EEQ8_JUGRE|nr:uncharacterized protein LOC109018521 [Juglans regia]